MKNLQHLKIEDQRFFCFRKEVVRQQKKIEYSIRENFVSLAVMEAMGTVFTNKYAEGYPRKKILCWLRKCRYSRRLGQR